MKIASAVTTSPRPNGVSYLQETLNSLHVAGFDPDVLNDPDFGGAWPALRKALAWLLETTKADGLAVFQDDVLAAKGLCGWLESNGWPIPVEQIGVMSLYTAGANTLTGGFGWYSSGDLPVFSPWGACGLLFPRHSAEKLVANPPCKAMLQGSDSHTYTHCRLNGLKFLMHTPSLLQHVGAVGSIGIGDNRGLTEERKARLFCEDVLQLAGFEDFAHDDGDASLGD